MTENTGQTTAIQRVTRSRLALRERQRQALDRRLAGETYQQIADALGYKSKCGAYKAVDGALREVTREPAEAVRALELARLDELYRAASPFAKNGEAVMIAACLRIMERRAKLLGLDLPPAELPPTGKDGDFRIFWDETSQASNIVYPDGTVCRVGVDIRKL
jgi:hypothetical protein